MGVVLDTAIILFQSTEIEFSCAEIFKTDKQNRTNEMEKTFFIMILIINDAMGNFKCDITLLKYHL